MSCGAAGADLGDRHLSLVDVLPAGRELAAVGHLVVDWFCDLLRVRTSSQRDGAGVGERGESVGDALAVIPARREKKAEVISSALYDKGLKPLVLLEERNNLRSLL